MYFWKTIAALALSVFASAAAELGKAVILVQNGAPHLQGAMLTNTGFM